MPPSQVPESEALDPRIPFALAHPAGPAFEPDAAPDALGAEAGPRADYPPEACAEAGVEHVQTHLSHVFLTRSRVYKLRKSIHFGFVDFRSREERIADCLREIALNRRLAPEIYLGLAAVWIRDGRVVVGELQQEVLQGEAPAEYCVVMQRLPEGHDAQSMLYHGDLRTEHLDATVDQLVRFHGANRLRAEGDEASSGADWVARSTQPARDNLTALSARPEFMAPSPIAKTLARIDEQTHAFVREHSGLLARRYQSGLCVDGHGDLHLQHVWFIHTDLRPTIIDCIEFRDDFRQLDPANEIAFLAMDLGYRDRRDLAEYFLAEYALQSDDYELFAIVDFFIGYRALVRAKVAALAAGDPEVTPEQRQSSAESALRHIEHVPIPDAAEPRPLLFALCGAIGSGKSTVTRELRRLCDGVPIVADRVRKQLAGISPLTQVSSSWGTGIYGSEMTRRTYAGLFERARFALDSGRAAVLDASFATLALRRQILEQAHPSFQNAILIHATCDAKLAADRLRERRERADDPSSASEAHLAASRAQFEAPDEWPKARLISVATDDPGWREQLELDLIRLGLRSRDS